MPAHGAPPGWHPDPWSGRDLRWWDGSAWSGHTSPRWQPAQGGTPWLVIVLSLLGVLLITAGGIAGLVVAAHDDSDGDSGLNATYTEPRDASPQPAAPTVPAAPADPNPYVPPGTHRKRPVALGSPVTLEDQDGARVRFTVESLRVVRPPRGALLYPATSKQRVVQAKIRLTTVGGRVYDDDVYNGLKVIVAGKPHRPLDDHYPACPECPIDFQLPPGSARSGCFLFKVPRAPDPRRVRFWASSENAPDVGYWRVP